MYMCIYMCIHINLYHIRIHIYTYIYIYVCTNTGHDTVAWRPPELRFESWRERDCAISFDLRLE